MKFINNRPVTMRELMIIQVQCMRFDIRGMNNWINTERVHWVALVQHIIGALGNDQPRLDAIPFVNLKNSIEDLRERIGGEKLAEVYNDEEKDLGLDIDKFTNRLTELTTNHPHRYRRLKYARKTMNAIGKRGPAPKAFSERALKVVRPDGSLSYMAVPLVPDIEILPYPIFTSLDWYAEVTGTPRSQVKKQSKNNELFTVECEWGTRKAVSITPFPIEYNNILPDVI